MDWAKITLGLVGWATFMGLPSGMQAADVDPTRSHRIVHNQRIDVPEEGLLLGNGDLSASVYQSGERIIWRFGKPDVWDRRLDLSDDPAPAKIDEIAYGIEVEGWKCGPYGGPVEATKGTENPQRMKELCQGAPPSYTRRPYPCPKPVGELILHLPPDLPGMKLQQRLEIEESRLLVDCSWPMGPRVELESFIHPTLNVLVIHWKVDGWNDTTRMGQKPPVWFSLERWADPTIQAFAARYSADCRHEGFWPAIDPKVTPLPSPTSVQLDGLWAVQQSFPADPTFPEGFRYLMAPLAPATAVNPLDLKATGGAGLHAMPDGNAREGWMAVAVTTSSDPGGPAAQLKQIQAAQAQHPAETFARWAEENRQAAASFWSQSRLRIDDPLLENLWYETLHARRCTYRRGVTPPGLILPSTVRDYSHWHGDYHTNYNFQEPFWGDYTANHLELGDAYFDGIQYLLPIGRKIAQDYYHCRGVFIQLSMYPLQASDDPLGVAPMGRMAYMTGWAMNQYWWRYRYTLDQEWLRTVGYPVIRDCALFYTDFLQKKDDGLYHIFPSNQGEEGFSGRPQDYTDRPQVMQHLRYCLRAAIQASEVLGTDAELRVTWQERLVQLAGDDGQPLPARTGLEKLCFEQNPPEFGVGRPWHPQPAQPQGAPWPPLSDNAYTWYFGQYPWMVMQRLHGDEFVAERDLPVFRDLVQRWRRPNGLCWGMSVSDYGRAGAWTESLGVNAPLQDMMLQSWDGALRIFPAWPKALTAQFEHLRAEGALLVSAAWSEGTVSRLEITSEKDGNCYLNSPWSQGIEVCEASGAAVAVIEDAWGRPGFATRAGGRYLVRPRP